MNGSPVAPRPNGLMAPREEPVAGHGMWATSVEHSGIAREISGLSGDQSICATSRAGSKERATPVQPIAAHVDEVDSEDMRLVEEAAEDEAPFIKTEEDELVVKMLTVKSESKASRNPSKTILYHSDAYNGGESFQSVMALAFEDTQSALVQSHEQALSLLSRCMEEIRQKDKANKELRKQLENVCGTNRGTSKELGRDLPERQKSGVLYDTRKIQSSRSKLEHDDPWADSLDNSMKPPNEDGQLPSAPMDIAPCMVLAVPDQDAAGSRKPSNQASGRGSPGTAPSGRGSPAVQVSRAESRARSESSSNADDRAMRVIQRRPSAASQDSVHSGTQNKFELLNMWKATKKKSRKRNKLGKLNRSCSFESLGSCESLDFNAGVTTSSCNCCGDHKLPILDPNSAKRAVWDISATLLICYDIVAIPLLLFDLPQGLFTIIMDWNLRIFWSLDIFMSFFTGFLQPNGAVELRARKIARNYILSWFFIDLFIVLSDWIEVIWANGSILGFARAGKASRTFRIIRMVRLIRLARVRKLYTAALDKLKNEQLVIIAGIINIMLVIMALGHVIACLWYGISNQDRPDTWLKVHGFEQDGFDYKYTTALHWSLLQFAGGTDEIVPQNTDERVYAIGVFLLAFVMAAVFVGRLTSSMTQLHMLSRKDVERFQALRRYLSKNEISGYLSMRVIHNAQHALQETQRFMEESRVELLTLISDPLRVELHFELYSPVLAVHPFFSIFIEAAPQVMKKVCHKAMSQLLVSDGDILFMPGEVPSPPRMIIVCSGELSYTYINGAIAYVQAGQWISEAVLWVQWTHQGMLKASKDCRLCILDGTKFCQIADTFDHDFDLRVYARTFVACMNDGSMDPSDLPWDDACTELMEAVEALAPHVESSPLEEPGSNRSTASSWGLSSAASEETSTMPKFKKSVLMVMPSSKESKEAWW